MDASNDSAPIARFREIENVVLKITDRQALDSTLSPFIWYLRNGEVPTNERDHKWMERNARHYRVKNDILTYVTAEGEWVVVSVDLQKEIMEAYNDDVLGGHLGVKKTLDKIRPRYFWPNRAKDVETWCKECKACLTKKGPPKKLKAELVPIPVNYPFERMVLDLAGPLPTTEDGNKYITVFSENLIKWVEAFALSDIESETIARVFLENIVCRHGAPKELLSDCGANLTSALIKGIYKLTNTRKIQTTPYHAQCDGLVERFNNYVRRRLSSQRAAMDLDRSGPEFSVGGDRFPLQIARYETLTNGRVPSVQQRIERARERDH